MLRPILTILTLLTAITINATEITSPTYRVSKKTDAVVHTALQMWKGDMQQVLGATPCAANDANIRIVQLDRDASALKNFPMTLSKGQHRLEIKALDDHILIDQWMVDFKKDRKFYVIPVR